MRYDIRARDGLARAGILHADQGDLLLPAAIDTARLFPGLERRAFTNVPLGAGREFAQKYLDPATDQPITVHPAHPGTSPGDCVMVANWHSAFPRPRQYVKWILDLKEQVAKSTVWYAPAAATPATAHMLCYTGFDLFDFRGVDLRTARGLFCLPEGDFPRDWMDHGLCRCSGCENGDLRTHNRLSLTGELALITRHIHAGALRELAESRCRMDAGMVAILRHLDQAYESLEPLIPIARTGPFRVNSAESLNRAEIRRFAHRVEERYMPPAADVAVLLPCSARKPYSLSRSHRLFASAVRGRGHELIVTSPLGLVPREMELTYPAAHYDVPVTGYWDREELSFISGVIARYLARHRYRRVIAHLDGGALRAAELAASEYGIDLECTGQGAPVSASALEALDRALDGEPVIPGNLVRGIGSWQFGIEIPSGGLRIRGRYPDVTAVRGTVPVFGIDPMTGLLRPTFEGWRLIGGVYRVRISDFIPQGDILAPGVEDADPTIRPGDEVFVEGSLASATGRAMMPGDEMRSSDYGVAVRVRKVKRAGAKPA
jgi:archaeosine synthase